MNYRLIDLPTRSDTRGSLMFAETGPHIPFLVRRIYLLYSIPQGSARGGHAHRALEQCFIATAGSFKIRISDGAQEASILLDTPDRALYLGPMMWRDLTQFAPGSSCLVLASAPFDEKDYIREYSEFQRAVRR